MVEEEEEEEEEVEEKSSIIVGDVGAHRRRLAIRRNPNAAAVASRELLIFYSRPFFRMKDRDCDDLTSQRELERWKRHRKGEAFLGGDRS